MKFKPISLVLKKRNLRKISREMEDVQFQGVFSYSFHFKINISMHFYTFFIDQMSNIHIHIIFDDKIFFLKY